MVSGKNLIHTTIHVSKNRLGCIFKSILLNEILDLEMH